MRTSAKTVATVKSGPLRIDIRAYADGRYGFDYKPPRCERIKVRAKERADAEKRARDVLAAASGGTLDLKAIKPHEFAEFFRWKETRAEVVSVPDLVQRFFAAKVNKGLSVRHTEDLKGTLDKFAEKFHGPIRELGRQDVEDFLTTPGVGPRRWNNKLKHIQSLIKFARREGVINTELHPVENITRRKTVAKKETYEPKEFAAMLRAANAHDRVFLVLCGLCGIRPQEARPEGSHKPGVEWGNFDWRRAIIDLPAEVSKTRERRFVPLCEAALAFLKDAKGEGECVPAKGAQYITKRIAKKSGVPWKPDALRHSYASYRLALTKDMPALALEMGNSPTMIRQYYLNLKHDDEAALWFSVRPDNLELFGTIST